MGTRIIVALAILASAWTCDRVEGHTAEGIIRDPAGRPVVGAEVRLYMPDHTVPPGRSRAPLLESQTTGEDGRYEFTVDAHEVQRPSALILARKEGLAWNVRRWVLPADVEVDLHLARPTKLTGLVVDADGRPIPKARVTLHTPRSTYVRGFALPEALSRELLSTTTGRDGRFRFDILSDDWQTEFIIEAEGYATLRTQHQPDSLYRTYEPGMSDIRFELQEEARICGTVVSETDRQPVEGIKVRIARRQSSVPYGFASATSDRDGRFTIGALPEGKLWMGVETSYVPDAAWVGWPIPVRTEAGETTQALTLEVTHGGMLEVTVRDDRDETVEDAGLTVFTREGNGLSQGRTDAEGVCRMRLPAGRYKLIDVTAWGYHSREPYLFFDVEAGQTVRREVTLKKARRLDGVVVDGEGDPVSNVQVTLMPSPTGTVLTDNRGRFAMIWDRWADAYESYQDHDFELVALDPAGGRTASLVMAEGMSDVRLVLEAGIRVTGTVVDTEGEPVESALISGMLRGHRWGMNLSGSKHVLTDGSGRFTMGPFPRGRTCEVYVHTPNHAKVERKFETPDGAERTFDLGAIELTTPDQDAD